MEDGPIVSPMSQLKSLPQVSRWHTELALKSAPESAFGSEAGLPGDLSQLQLRRLQERAGKFTPDLFDRLCGCHARCGHELPMEGARRLTGDCRHVVDGP